jgi:hypothetical protein
VTSLTARGEMGVRDDDDNEATHHGGVFLVVYYISVKSSTPTVWNVVGTESTN